MGIIEDVSLGASKIPKVLEIKVHIDGEPLRCFYDSLSSDFVKMELGKLFSREERLLFVTGADYVETSLGRYKKIDDCAKLTKVQLPARFLKYELIK